MEGIKMGGSLGSGGGRWRVMGSKGQEEGSESGGGLDGSSGQGVLGWLREALDKGSMGWGWIGIKKNFDE